MNDLIVPTRFNGPVRSGNGGFVAGSLAERVSTADVVEVTLRRPPPLEIPMAITSDAGVTTLAVGDEVVASARIVDLELVAVDEVPPDVAASAMLGYPGLVKHPFPTCFACGPDRAEGDGLRIFPGPVADGRVAATWTPGPSVAADWHEYRDASREVGHAVTWAALDCAGGWAADIGARLMVLGTMTARLHSLPRVGEEHVVVGAARGESGRKRMSAVSLYDAAGGLVGTAEHVWIAVDPKAFN